MRKLFVIILLAIGLAGYSQSKHGKFLRPVPDNLFNLGTSKNPVVAITSSAWIPRPALNIVAAKWWIDKETKKVGFSSFSAIALGIGWEHYTPTSDTDPTPYNDYGFNGLLLLGENICVGVTFNYNVAGAAIIHFGADYNFPLKRPELLTGVKFEF